MNLVTATTPYSQAVKSFLENPREVYAVRFIRPDVGKERSPVLKHVYKVASVTQQVTMGALVSGVMFGGFSTLMGLFAASAMASDPTKTVTMTDSFKDMMQTLRRRARSGFRSGAMIGAAFAFTDPISDTYFGHSPFMQGFSAGLLVGLRGGPMMTLGSGIGFGMFGYVIEASGIREKMGF